MIDLLQSPAPAGRDLAGYRFRRQWAIASDRPLDELSERRDLGHGVSLFAHPEAFVTSHEAGALRVYCLGVGVRGSGQALFDGVDTEDDLLALLDDLNGVYTLITVTPDSLRVYTDPGGMMNVFLGDGGVIASTPAALPETRGAPAGPSVKPGRDDWMLWDRTPFAGVRVLPANHMLDATTGQTERFWPRDEFTGLSRDEAIVRGAGTLRESARALAGSHSVLVSLTGGLDSRVSLAALDGVEGDISAFTLDRVPSRERALVERLAERAGVDHRWVEVDEAPPGVLRMYDEITLGMSVGARREVGGGCWTLRDTDAVHLSGNLGAIAKAFYWPNGKAVFPTPDLLLRDFVDKNDERRAGAEAWIAGLPAWLTPHAACNLAYLEQRGGRWMGVGETASSLYYAPTTFFSSRALFETISSAPTEEQRDGRLLRAFVERLAPDLASEPYASGTSAWRLMLPARLKAVLGPLLKGRF